LETRLPDEEGLTTVAFAGESCLAVVRDTDKAHACCSGLIPELDCQRWPFEGTRAPGESCAVHADCQAGLLCIAEGLVELDPVPEGEPNPYGLCLCPGVEPERVIAWQTCLEGTRPDSWAEDPRTELPDCEPALEPGFVVETMQGEYPRQRPSVTLASDGGIHVAYAHEQTTVHYAVWDERGFEVEDVFPNGGQQTDEVFLALDAADVPHIVGAPSTFHVRKMEGAWQMSLVGRASRSVALAVSPDGTPHVAVFQQDRKLSWGFLEDDWVMHATGLSVRLGSPALLFRGDQPVLFFEQEGTTSMAHLHPDGLNPMLLAVGDSPHAQVGADGSLHIVLARHDALATIPVETPAEVSLIVLEGEVRRDLTLWTLPTNRFVSENPAPSLALEKDGSRWVAHRAPEGILLHHEQDGKFSHVTLVPEAGVPALLLDANDEPHVFYAAHGHALGPLRHVHRGSCP
jgi:hypothetical protein